MSLQLAPQLVDLKLGQDMERILGLEVGFIHWHLKELPPRDLLLMKGQQLLNQRGKRGK